MEPRLLRLPNGWFSRQSRKPSLYVILVQDNNGGDSDLLLTREIRPRHQNRSNGASRYVRCKVNGNPSSRVKVLATGGDDHFLGKHNYDRVSKNRVGTVEYQGDRLSER